MSLSKSGIRRDEFGVVDWATTLGSSGGPMDGGYTQVSNIDLPAGYTYFAQFVFHDLTHRYPGRLDLTSLYGDGPIRTAEFYQVDRPWLLAEGRRVTGRVADLPRHTDGRAHIPDVRNDRNLMIGQIHARFIRYHNQLADRLPNMPAATRYAIARSQTTHCYRALVMRDFLPRLTSSSTFVADDGYPPSTPAVSFDRVFRLAVGQFGHAMVKPRYRLNDDRQAVLFRPTGLAEPYDDLRGQPLDATGVIDWTHFFPTGDSNKLQRAGRINTSICAPLFIAPSRQGACSIPYLTLRSAQHAGLPSGPYMARRIGLEPLAPEQLRVGSVDFAEFADEVPLWFYVLREADVTEHGRRLGPLGTYILMCVIEHALDISAPADDLCGSPSTHETVGDFLTAVAR
ncbi:peroxidase family protein [Nocardia gipuzkoensis]